MYKIQGKRCGSNNNMKKNQVVINILIAFIFFLAYTIFITYPMIFQIGNGFYGVHGDVSAEIWNYWRMSYVFKNGMSFEFTPMVSAPFGFDILKIPFQFFELWPSQALTILTNEFFAYNFRYGRYYL